VVPTDAEAAGGNGSGAAQAEAVQAAFEQLRQRFLAGLPQRWHDIRTASDGAAQRAALHRLAGAAGGYGFSGLGEAARCAEALSESGDSRAMADAMARLRAALIQAGVTVS
jgi:hypothetical protein